MKFLLDSSVFIAFFKEEDLFHKETFKLIEILSEEDDVVIVVPVIIFLETVNILNKITSGFKSRQIFEIFKRYETIDLTLESSKSIIRFFKDLNLKTSDATIVATSKITFSTLITWDKKLQKEARKIVETLTPKEFLEKI